MGIFLDIAASAIIGAILLGTVLSLNASLIENSHRATMEVAVQRNLGTITALMLRDLKNMGYKVSPAVSTARSDTVFFRGDLNDDGSADSVGYFLGPVDELAGTENPGDRTLIRNFNGARQLLATGVTSLDFSYFGAAQEKIERQEGETAEQRRARQASIVTVQVSVIVESPYKYGRDYTKAIGKFRVSPKNLTLG
ncbi:MAG: hypothetical protein QME66_01755 [Candidatus Eisenbacteria bacterium]|nr:hypothetical protein [Candidatus Eisenbacteria bacterium]